MKRPSTFLVAVLAGMAVTGVAWAEDLTLGIATETTSVDPHNYNTSSNLQIAEHVFESLIVKDHLQHLQPGLAVSWKPLDDKVWEFKLRQGVKFHDGTPLTADDVVFTHQRATTLKGYSSPPGRYQKNKKMKKVDDSTVHVWTENPYPNMVREMSIVHIVSRKHGTDTKAEHYNTGKATIGSGPYKFVEWIKGDRLVVVKNPDYWGEKEPWDKVTFKPIPSDPARIAALLSGAVDLIDYVPTTDLKSLRGNSKVALSETQSNRVIYMQFDSNRDLSTDILDNGGQPLWPNPLRQWKVRKAISMAINRQAIVDRVMEGAAVPASQLEGSFIYGHNPDLKVEPYDPEGAKKLLAEAGYPNGFQITVRGPNDRYVNDAKIVEVVAQMLTRVGIKSKVATLPRSVYFGKMRGGGPLGTPGYSFALIGSGTDTGEGLSSAIAGLHTYMPEKNLGWVNRGRYSNVRVDALLEKASVTLNDDEREKLLQEAGGIAVRDLAYLPLHYQKNVWAHRPDLAYRGRTDERTYAMGVRKK